MEDGEVGSGEGKGKENGKVQSLVNRPRESNRNRIEEGEIVDVWGENSSEFGWGKGRKKREKKFKTRADVEEKEWGDQNDKMDLG